MNLLEILGAFALFFIIVLAIGLYSGFVQVSLTIDRSERQ